MTAARVAKELAELLRDLLEMRRFIAAGEAKSFAEADYMSRAEDATRADIESLFAALQSENERLKETALTPPQAKWLLRHALIISAWPEIGDALRRISSSSEETS